MFAGDKFADHGSEFVPFHISKMRSWPGLVVFPGLFRSWTEPPITNFESCCVGGHIIRLSWTFCFTLLTLPVGDVVEHAREDEPVWKTLKCVLSLRHELL